MVNIALLVLICRSVCFVDSQQYLLTKRQIVGRLLFASPSPSPPTTLGPFIPPTQPPRTTAPPPPPPPPSPVASPQVDTAATTQPTTATALAPPPIPSTQGAPISSPSGYRSNTPNGGTVPAGRPPVGGYGQPNPGQRPYGQGGYPSGQGNGQSGGYGGGQPSPSPGGGYGGGQPGNAYSQPGPSGGGYGPVQSIGQQGDGYSGQSNDGYGQGQSSGGGYGQSSGGGYGQGSGSGSGQPSGGYPGQSNDGYGPGQSSQSNGGYSGPSSGGYGSGQSPGPSSGGYPGPSGGYGGQSAPSPSNQGQPQPGYGQPVPAPGQTSVPSPFPSSVPGPGPSPYGTSQGGGYGGGPGGSQISYFHITYQITAPGQVVSGQPPVGYGYDGPGAQATSALPAGYTTPLPGQYTTPRPGGGGYAPATQPPGTPAGGYPWQLAASSPAPSPPSSYGQPRPTSPPNGGYGPAPGTSSPSGGYPAQIAGGYGPVQPIGTPGGNPGYGPAPAPAPAPPGVGNPGIGYPAQPSGGYGPAPAPPGAGFPGIPSGGYPGPGQPSGGYVPGQPSNPSGGYAGQPSGGNGLQQPPSVGYPAGSGPAPQPSSGGYPAQIGSGYGSGQTGDQTIDGYGGGFVPGPPSLLGGGFGSGGAVGFLGGPSVGGFPSVGGGGGYDGGGGGGYGNGQTDGGYDGGSASQGGYDGGSAQINGGNGGYGGGQGGGGGGGGGGYDGGTGQFSGDGVVPPYVPAPGNVPSANFGTNGGYIPDGQGQGQDYGAGAGAGTGTGTGGGYGSGTGYKYRAAVQQSPGLAISSGELASFLTGTGKLISAGGCVGGGCGGGSGITGGCGGSCGGGCPVGTSGLLFFDDSSASGNQSSADSCYRRICHTAIVNAQPYERRADASLDECKGLCRSTTRSFQCRSFVYDSSNHICDLFAHTGDQPPSKLVRLPNRDYYEPNTSPKCANASAADAGSCPSGQSARYIAVPGYQSSASGGTQGKGSTIQVCQDACNTGKTPDGKPIVCKSFDFNQASNQCTFYDSSSAIGANGAGLQATSNTIHVDRICIDSTAAQDCKGPFERDVQSIIIGHAETVVDASSFTDCMQQCIQAQTGCNSGMFYYAVKTQNCILNRVTKTDQPDLFKRQITEDTVDYFEPNCKGAPVSVISATSRFSSVRGILANRDKKKTTKSETVVQWTEWSSCDDPKKSSEGVRVRHKKCGKSSIDLCPKETSSCPTTLKISGSASRHGEKKTILEVQKFSLDEDEATSVEPATSTESSKDQADNPGDEDSLENCPPDTCCAVFGSCRIGLKRSPNGGVTLCPDPCSNRTK